VLLLGGCGRIAFDPLDTDAPSTGGIADTALVWYSCEDDLSDGVSNDRRGAIPATCPSAAECPKLAPGHVGMACDFDGIDDYLRARGAILDTTAGFSVAFWAQADTADGMIVSKTLGSMAGDSWGVFVNPEVEFEVYSTPTSSVTIIAPFSIGPWNHVVATWDGAVSRVYTGGVLQMQDFSVAAFDGHDVILAGDENDDTAGPPSFFFDGRIDELQIYDRPLSQAEIDELVAQSAIRD
jgi:hypothetical protein